MAGSLELRRSELLVRQALLKKLPDELKRGCADASLKNAEEMANTARRVAPVSEDSNPGQLRNSHRVVANADGSATAMAGGPDAPYAIHVEQGTRKMDARPFWWPTYRLLKRRFKQRYSRALGKVVKAHGA